MNKIILIGNVCRDIEKRTTQGGVSVTSFALAVNRPFKNAQGVVEADFIECVAWRETADFIAQHFIKGNKLALEGRLQTRTYDAQDGSKRKATEVVVEHVEFVAPRARSVQPVAQTAPQAQQGFEEVDEPELPF